jgi:CRP-like cAMP-binding protein/thioredoxin reductase/Fe-S-cluster-containing dehydrogenase component
MYDLIVIGAGPAGLSAACHAQQNGMNVLLLEKGELANTIFDYQKGKHVMAEPPMIPLRSDVPFKAGTREFLLQTWSEAARAAEVKIQRPEEVKGITKSGDLFTVKTGTGEYVAKHVLLAIGIQGNPRTLTVPGASLPHVSTKLADPSIYENEDILMVGAGDAAIEGVLALCEKNRVGVVNRSPEFFRLKDALFRDITQKVEMKQVTPFHNAAVERIEEGYAYVKMPEQTVKVKADLVFVRIGAEIPRPFLERIGVTFASTNPSAAPVLTKHYETNVPGLFMIGAVAGYGLIKQGMNQGYDVVEYLLGHDVEAVEEPIIRDQRLGMLQGSTDERLNEVRSTTPLLADVLDTALRELILASTVHSDVKARTAIYREDHYSDSLFIILRGSVKISRPTQGAEEVFAQLGAGEFFGETSLVSGLRRSEKAKAVTDSVLFEIPRRAVLRLLNAEPSVKRAIDENFIVRALQLYLLPDAQLTFLRSLASRAVTCSYKQGEVVYKAGDPGDDFYLVRSGSMKISKRSGAEGKEVVVNHLPVGRSFGEIELLDPSRPKRQVTVTATKTSELIRFKRKDFNSMVERYPDVGERLRKQMQEMLVRSAEVFAREVGGDHLINKMVDSGVFEGTDVLFIDEDKCVRCDQCMQACASTHQGQTRLYRTEGNIFGNLLVPSSCRHCENPMCLTDCPPGNAILRDKSGEVYIDPVRCIGCGNCAKNCPYGNIFMVHPTKVEEVGPVDRLLNIIGLGRQAAHHEEGGEMKAIKCDLCKDKDHGPACVRICPTGAAFRVSPNEYFKRIGVGGH